MRVVKFKGKRISDSVWIYGSLVITQFKDNPKEKYYITTFLGNFTFDHEVIPESVGQYTGFTDIDGQEIYEHDSVSVIDTDLIRIIEWHDGGWECNTKGGDVCDLTRWNSSNQLKLIINS